VQPLAHRVLGIPRGDSKKTDVAITQEQLETLDKFKGAQPQRPAPFPWVHAEKLGVSYMPRRQHPPLLLRMVQPPSFFR
jgi:hypothetical protein